MRVNQISLRSRYITHYHRDLIDSPPLALLKLKILCARMAITVFNCLQVSNWGAVHLVYPDPVDTKRGKLSQDASLQSTVRTTLRPAVATIARWPTWLVPVQCPDQGTQPSEPQFTCTETRKISVFPLGRFLNAVWMPGQAMLEDSSSFVLAQISLPPAVSMTHTE